MQRLVQLGFINYLKPNQSFHLSPMLFIVAMDVLHMMFAKASRDGVLRPMELQEIKFNAAYTRMT